MSRSEVEIARARIWQEMPSEVEALTEKRGMLRPLAPLSYAEAETRLHAELVSALVLGERGGALPAGTAKASIVDLLLKRLQGHFDGWYELPEAAAFLGNALDSLDSAADDEEAAKVLEEVALYLTRLGLWLDLLIPWNDLNDRMIEQLEASRPD